MRTSHTNQQGKAKCLAYRNGKRCGRVAKFEVVYGQGSYHRHQAVCQECKGRLAKAFGESFQVNKESPKGFYVKSNTSSGWTHRTYIKIY